MKTPIVLFAIIAVLLVAVSVVFTMRGSDTPEAAATPFITSVGAFDSPSYITSHEPPNDPYSVAVEVTEEPSATPRPSSTPRPKPTPSESSTIRPSPTPEQVYIDIELPEVPEGVAFEDATGFNVYSVPLDKSISNLLTDSNYNRFVGSIGGEQIPLTNANQRNDTLHDVNSHLDCTHRFLSFNDKWYSFNIETNIILAFNLTSNEEPDIPFDKLSIVFAYGEVVEFTLNGVDVHQYFPIIFDMKFETNSVERFETPHLYGYWIGFENGDVAVSDYSGYEIANYYTDEETKRIVTEYCREKYPLPFEKEVVDLYAFEGFTIAIYYSEKYLYSVYDDPEIPRFTSNYYSASRALLLIKDGIISEIVSECDDEIDALLNWDFYDVAFRYDNILYVLSAYWEWYAIHTYTIP